MAKINLKNIKLIVYVIRQLSHYQKGGTIKNRTIGKKGTKRNFFFREVFKSNQKYLKNAFKKICFFMEHLATNNPPATRSPTKAHVQ